MIGSADPLKKKATYNEKDIFINEVPKKWRKIRISRIKF